MDLALFDLDETLICEDTASLWLLWLVSQGYADDAIVRQDEALMQRYYQGTLQMEEYMDTLLAPIAGKATLTVDGWVRRFIQRDILPRVYPAALARLQFHQQRGDTLLVISANGDHLVSPIARQLGAHGALAIGMEVVNDCYTGKTQGTFTYQQGKVARLREWQAQHPELRFNHIWAYSDSHNDLPMLALADFPHAINPDAALEQQALSRGWPVWRWTK
ncbi:HAD family phosphatase [Pantoea sp. 1.19]|uniref:HAD family hydrolase n=1 Tax=Pantoea sp. 1.19 TaxID=1925589 RepID=UPI0009490756|nr:HAD family hydrolase [Pantoea sp. 1.19]